MPTLEAVREDLDTATNSLDDIRNAMRDGQDVDLETFNLKVAETCKSAVELPRADIPKVREQLETLLSQLNAIRAEIEAEQEEVAAQLARTEASTTRTDHSAGISVPDTNPDDAA
jgi:vacuolar-type H+-ATPase subunit I/STV1